MMPGKVYLVGAGPGDPDLLTVKATRLLRKADVVLYDDLVSNSILALIHPAAQVINVGKRCKRKLFTQDEINGLMRDFAQKPGTVVRLKSGDPSVFGRVGEELEFLQEQGIAVEVVPGITAALAAAAAAQISLSDRRTASQVLFISGHRCAGKDPVDWSQLVSSGTTLCVYMPGQDYATVSSRLLQSGAAPDMPCLIVSAATVRDQKFLWTHLSQLGRIAPLPSPAVLIVGKVAGNALVQITDDIFHSRLAPLPIESPQF